MILLDDKAKAQKSIPVIVGEKRTCHFEMHKIADFHSKMLVSRNC